MGSRYGHRPNPTPYIPGPDPNPNPDPNSDTKRPKNGRETRLRRFRICLKYFELAGHDFPRDTTSVCKNPPKKTELPPNHKGNTMYGRRYAANECNLLVWPQGQRLLYCRSSSAEEPILRASLNCFGQTAQRRLIAEPTVAHVNLKKITTRIFNPLGVN